MNAVTSYSPSLSSGASLSINTDGYKKSPPTLTKASDSKLKEKIKQIKNSGISPAEQDIRLKSLRIEFEKSANKPNSSASERHELAMIYAMGIGGERDLEKAKELLEPLARNGDPKAKYNLAVAYHITGNIEGSKKLYEELAYSKPNRVSKGTLASAQYNLALMKQGNPATLQEAKELHEKARQNGSEKARFVLDMIAYKGEWNKENIDWLYKTLETDPKSPVKDANEKLAQDSFIYDEDKDELYSGSLKDDELTKWGQDFIKRNPRLDKVESDFNKIRKSKTHSINIS